MVTVTPAEVATLHPAQLQETDDLSSFPVGMKQSPGFRVFALLNTTPPPNYQPLLPMGTADDANFILIPDVKSVPSDLIDSWGMC